MQIALIAASASLLASSVNAHGYLVQPAANFVGGQKDTTYNALIDSATLPAPFAGKKWNDNPAANAKTFTDAFKASTYKDIKTLMDTAAPDCGKTLLDGTPVDVSGMKSVKWANDQEKKGFVTSHTGPCEVWIDDKMVMHEDECVSKFPGYPADMPVDFSSCKGKCKLTFYWLALHEPKWQVYKQCASIQNGAGGGSAPSPATPSASSPATPSAPSPATPSAPSSPSAPSPASPATTPKPAAPSPATPSNPAPAPSKACKRRVRSLRN